MRWSLIAKHLVHKKKNASLLLHKKTTRLRIGRVVFLSIVANDKNRTILPFIRRIVRFSHCTTMHISCKTSPAGVEPATYGLEGRCSIQLSYEDIVENVVHHVVKQHFLL